MKDGCFLQFSVWIAHHPLLVTPTRLDATWFCSFSLCCIICSTHLLPSVLGPVLVYPLSGAPLGKSVHVTLWPMHADTEQKFYSPTFAFFSRKYHISDEGSLFSIAFSEGTHLTKKQLPHSQQVQWMRNTPLSSWATGTLLAKLVEAESYRLWAIVLHLAAALDSPLPRRWTVLYALV